MKGAGDGKRARGKETPHREPGSNSDKSLMPGKREAARGEAATQSHFKDKYIENRETGRPPEIQEQSPMTPWLLVQ